MFALLMAPTNIWGMKLNSNIFVHANVWLRAFFQFHYRANYDGRNDDYR